MRCSCWDRAAATFARTSHASAVGIHGVPASTRTCLHSPKPHTQASLHQGLFIDANTRDVR